MSLELKLDCRHFSALKPCRYGGACAGCRHYARPDRRILIIKLDAIGDVARTTTLLPALHGRYPGCHVTWLTAPEAVDLLDHNPRIDVVLPYGFESVEALRCMRFDLVLSLDKTVCAAAVAGLAGAPLKYGFGLSEYGTVYPLNEEAEYAFELGISDDLKFRRNQKTYQQIVFEAVKLPYNGEEYSIEMTHADEAFAADFCRRNELSENDLIVGLNMGGGAAFANKMWSTQRCIEFVKLLEGETDARVLLFGAERERAAMQEIHAECGATVHTGCDNTLRQFMALLGRCDAVVTGDSLGMHLALARQRAVVVLFGPTCHQEIELYGRGEKIVSPISCTPCYRASCEEEPSCMDLIKPEEVLDAVTRQVFPTKRKDHTSR